MNPDPAAASGFSTHITQRALSPRSFTAQAADAQPPCGSSSAWSWIIGTSDRAEKEADDLGMNNPKLKQFAIDYAMSHKR